MANPLGNDIQDLWRSMQDGEAEALAGLFKIYFAMLFDYGMKLCGNEELVKDSIQEIFVTLWNRRSRLSVPRSVKGYLLAALRRQLLSTLHHNRRQTEALSQLEWNDAFSPEDLLIVRETEAARRRALQAALAEIPARIREALYLKTYQNLSYQEIASTMQVSPQVARNYVCEAFQRLRQILKKFQDFCIFSITFFNF